MLTYLLCAFHVCCFCAETKKYLLVGQLLCHTARRSGFFWQSENTLRKRERCRKREELPFGAGFFFEVEKILSDVRFFSVAEARKIPLRSGKNLQPQQFSHLTPTPNTIYGQQGDKPPCHEHLNNKFSVLRIGQPPRTQFTHSKRQIRTPGRHQGKIFASCKDNSHSARRPTTERMSDPLWCTKSHAGSAKTVASKTTPERTLDS